MRKIAFTIADDNNLKYLEMFKKSLRKFHSKEELPLREVTGAELQGYLQKDPQFFYRATPILAKELTEYDCVIKFDCDQIVTGDLSALWEGNFDVGVVNNSNPREMKDVLVSVWNVHPLAYANCGLVVMKSKRFIDHWFNQCFKDHFNVYQYREQDLLNILIQYGDYIVKRFDEGDSYYGLASKGYWPQVELDGKQLILRKNEEWPQESDKYIKVLHWAGGNVDKMNYQIRFQPEVIKRLDEIVS